MSDKKTVNPNSAQRARRSGKASLIAFREPRLTPFAHCRRKLALPPAYGLGDLPFGRFVEAHASVLVQYQG